MTHRDGFPRLSASTRVAWRCGTSQAMRDAVRPLAESPWEAAVPVGQANRQRAPVGASESLDDPSSAAAALPLRRVDVPPDPRLPCTPHIGPTDRLPDPYGSLSRTFGIRAMEKDDIAGPISMGHYQRSLV